MKDDAIAAAAAAAGVIVPLRAGRFAAAAALRQQLCRYTMVVSPPVSFAPV